MRQHKTNRVEFGGAQGFIDSFIPEKLTVEHKSKGKDLDAAFDPAESVAILAANGKLAQAIRTNAEVVPGVTVKEVNRSYVLLSEGGVIKRVELPADARRK